tara:strand:+ start:664 stop:837 length:174 start_codon:yes stop_codon:yes gene_type:complete
MDKLSKYELKIEKIYDIYTINNKKYDGLYNYVFSKGIDSSNTGSSIDVDSSYTGSPK